MDKLPANKRYAIYVRSAAWSEDSNHEQESLCRQYVESQGGTVTHLFVDNGNPGTYLERPGYQAMLESAKLAEFDEMVCQDPARIARGEQQLRDALKQIRGLGIEIACANGMTVDMVERSDEFEAFVQDARSHFYGD